MTSGQRNYFVERLNQHGLEFTEFSQQESTELREQLKRQFAKGHERDFWDLFSFGPKLYGDRAYTRLEEYFRGRETIFMHKPNLLTNNVFRVADGAKFIRALDQMGEREFYLTDAKMEFLVFSYHHDVTSGAGLAENWIDELQNEVYNRLSVIPKSIAIPKVEMQDWGYRLVFHCVYDPDGDKRPFEFQFSGCNIRYWSAHNPQHRTSLGTSPEVPYQFLLDRTEYKQRADIGCTYFQTEFWYDELEITWKD